MTRRPTKVDAGTHAAKVVRTVRVLLKTGASARPPAAGAARPTPRPERQAAFRLGLSAESRAAAFLIAKGYRILARRWRGPVGEVDIVARRRGVLAFVEVKARADLESAAYAISAPQMHRIAAAAEAWLAHRPQDAGCAIRFDAVLVAPRRLPQHLRGAFEAPR